MVAGALPSPTHALWTLIVSYILWGIGIPLALFTLVLYYHRLTLHSIPPPAVLSSVFLPLGPLGEGGFGIMQLGTVSRTVFPLTKTLSLVSDAGDIVFVFGFFTALLMWGFGLAWLFWELWLVHGQDHRSTWAGGVSSLRWVFSQGLLLP